MGFFGVFGKKKLEQTRDAINRAIVEFDPETATEAAIEMMEDQVDALSQELAKENQALVKERREADAAKEKFNRMLEAANKLQEKVDAETGEKKASLQGSLDKLLEQLEDTRPDVELEIQEAEDAEVVVATIKESLDMAVDKLKHSRRDHKRARNDMKRAEHAERRAKAEEDRAKRLAGVGGKQNDMDVALTAMREAATEREAAAEAANMKADLIRPFDASEDDNISAVLAEVDGDEPEPDTKTKLGAMQGF